MTDDKPKSTLTHAEISAKGGRAGTGKAKARTKAQARKAANARWKKYRADLKSGIIAK